MHNSFIRVYPDVESRIPDFCWDHCVDRPSSSPIFYRDSFSYTDRNNNGNSSSLRNRESISIQYCTANGPKPQSHSDGRPLELPLWPGARISLSFRVSRRSEYRACRPRGCQELELGTRQE